MACDLTLGRIEPCKDSVGGINAVYFINFGDSTGVTYDVTNTDEIKSLGAGVTAYKYEVRGASDYTETITTSRDTGTTYFAQSLNLTLKKLSVADHKEIKLLAYGRPHIVIQDNNGNAFIAGLEHGCEVAGTIVTGNAMGDLNGYTLNATAMERVPANFLDGATTANPFAGMTNPVTIVTGS